MQTVARYDVFLWWWDSEVKIPGLFCLFGFFYHIFGLYHLHFEIIGQSTEQETRRRERENDMQERAPRAWSKAGPPAICAGILACEHFADLTLFLFNNIFSLSPFLFCLSTCRFNKIQNTKNTMKKDGISSLTYRLVQVKKYPLYTNISVEIGKPPPRPFKG